VAGLVLSGRVRDRIGIGPVVRCRNRGLPATGTEEYDLETHHLCHHQEDPESRMLSGDGPATSVKGSPCFSGKTGRFWVPREPPLFFGHSGPRWVLNFDMDLRLSGFCAFSDASKLHGFFAIKSGIFGKQRFKQRIFWGVGTISTAEFFRYLALKILRRRMIIGDLQSSPLREYIKRGR
jgi:hypothetical protein